MRASKSGNVVVIAISETIIAFTQKLSRVTSNYKNKKVDFEKFPNSEISFSSSMMACVGEFDLII